MTTCNYCQHFANAKVISRKKKTDAPYKRKCHASKKRITSDSEVCKYLLPKEIFYCDINDNRLHLLQCLARRRNSKNLPDFKACEKCRQFDKDIRHILSRYFLDAEQPLLPKGFKEAIPKNAPIVVNPGRQRKIKRRQSRQILKRRKPKARVIKRRPKPKTRKIKRRKR